MLLAHCKLHRSINTILRLQSKEGSLDKIDTRHSLTSLPFVTSEQARANAVGNPDVLQHPQAAENMLPVVVLRTLHLDSLNGLVVLTSLTQKHTCKAQAATQHIQLRH